MSAKVQEEITAETLVAIVWSFVSLAYALNSLDELLSKGNAR